MEEKNFNYIYFNVSYDKSKDYKVYLPQEYKGFDSLEMIKEIDTTQLSGPYITKFYRFKIFSDSIELKDEKMGYKIDIWINDENQAKYKYTIKFKNINKDFYEFNFKIDKLDILPLNYDEQFQIYVDILRKIYNKIQNTKENEDFIESAQLLLEKKDEKYDFLFYLLIFLECFSIKLVQKQFLLFDPKRIKGIGKFPEIKFKPLANILNRMASNPQQIHVESEDKRQESTELFYSIVLFFNLNFQRDKVHELFENEKSFNYLFNKLESFKSFFKDLILPENVVIKLVEKAKEYNQILSFLFYLGKDVLKFLTLLNNKTDFILKLYKKENTINEENKKIIDKIMHKKIKNIEVEKYVEPRKEDDLEKISKIIKDLLGGEDMNFIKFSSAIIDKYIDLNDQVNLDNLINIKNIIESIQKKDTKFKSKYKIEKNIHLTGILFAKRGNLKNLKLLDFIQKDDYYQNKTHNKSGDRSIDIFDGIEIETLEKDFFTRWETINFPKMFESHFTEFLQKIASLIKEMKDFGLLFSFFSTEHQKELKNECVTIMQNKYKEIFHTYLIEVCPNFIKDTCELIYLSDIKRVGLKKFLKDDLQKLLDVHTINDIYIYLTENFNNLSKECSKIIVEFFTTDKKNDNPSSLIFLIEKCKKLRRDIFSNLDKFIIKNEEEFFYPENTVNYNFFKDLQNKKLLDKAQNDKTEYVSETMKIITLLQEKIKKLNINYKSLIYFFNEDNQNKENIGLLEATLKERIFTIFQNDPDLAMINFNEIKTKMKETIVKIKFFEEIIKYLRDFYPNVNKNDIKNLSSIVYNLKNNNINYYESHYKNEYQNYLKYEEGTKKRKKMQKSEFFNMIFKEMRKKYQTDDKKFIEETDKTFDKFKNIFIDKNGVNKMDEKLLKLCLEPFKENENNLSKEIKTLIELYNIQEFNENERLKEELLLISKREYILNTAASIISFVDTIGTKKSEYRKVFEKVIENLKKGKDIAIIKKMKDALKNLEIDIDEKKNKYIDVLIKFKEQPEIITFLFEKTIEECRNLQEILSENENNFVSANDILDMEKCVIFMNNFGKLNDLKEKKDIDVISLFREQFSKKNDIFIYFEKLFINYSQIFLLQSHLDKSELLKYKINALFNNAIFTLKNTKTYLFKCVYYEDNKWKESTKENIISLRERAQLTKIITPLFKVFIKTISEIINIYNIIQKIFKKGYPKIIIVEIKISKIEKEKNDIEEKGEKINIKKEFIMNNNQQKDYNETIEKLKNILADVEMKQINGYQKKPLIRYLYGRQFNLIYNYLNKEENKKNIEPLLQFITNDQIKNYVEDIQKEQNGEIIESYINDCEKYLNEILKKNNLNLEKIYENSIIKQMNKKYEGIYVYKCEKLEKDLFQIYYYLTNNNPISQNILLCNKETSKEEITSFFYRAILCEYNSLFIIGGIEFLEFEQKICLINLLNHFFPKEEEKIKSCLIFLYTNKSSDIYKNLEMKKYKKVLDLNRNIFESIDYKLNDIEIIKSDKSGVGKSTQIRKDIEGDVKKWIYFPFGGVLKREEIIERLKGLEIDKNSVLHLDLYNTDQISLMMEFLFSLLITRFFGQNEDIFFLPKNIKIKIEIPNTFINFLEKFQILTLFKIKEMKISDLPPLIVPKELNSNIQIVANYLKALNDNKINQFDLFFPKITPEIFLDNIIMYKNKKEKVKTTIKAELLSDKECQDLIFKTIKERIKEPTYYQIISFINVLAIQLKKFNQNFYLNAHQLLSAKGIKASQIRTFIIQSFIKLTKHFTEGAFTNLIKNQETAHKTIFGQYDENNDINNAINNLAKYDQDIISFEKIDPSLLFFHEGTGQSFSIITNKKKTDQEYIDLLALVNSQQRNSKNNVKELPNYRKYSKFQFLEELKEILGINNPVKTSQKDPKNEYKSLEEISDKYVFTDDNFVKRILILLRLRSSIPVIMMGETGCGKTALIRKLSEMKNNGTSEKMKILNIHAGTTDKDIIDFINNKVLPESKEISEKEKPIKEKNEKIGLDFEETKIWVFLDEINTCKSMGLISELMCKHTCLGKQLPSNIVFIAACNPYRQREKKDNKKNINAGLDINQAHQQKKFLNDKELDDINQAKNSNLVYLVNPLPHSLLNFVFDFGNLKAEYEKEYIKCIIRDSLEKIYYKGLIPKNEKEIEKDEKLNKLKSFACQMIIGAQNYIREFQDKSAVSLREIRRFNIFYEFFYGYLSNRKQTIVNQKDIELDKGDNGFYFKLDEYSLQINGIILSIFVSYYLRIADKKNREVLHKKMNEIYQNFDKLYKEKDFLELPLREQQYIINNIKIDKGIAKNRALLDNIFSLFVAINTNVPIFIVGKPGCSKSLSVQLLIKSMLGNTSNNSLFKKLPKVLVYSYQGSMSSTSKGVENVFNKARSDHQKLEEENKSNNIPLIFFDEMGLAEHSPNNPLKVIHSELEYDQNKGENRVAFVGISNWVLDAAKMNRGISISILEPDEKDNEETALTIGKSYNENLADKNEIFFKNLGKSYFLYKKYLIENHNLDGKEDFHGNRDFYHLVKNSSRNIIIKEKYNQLNEQTLMEIALRSIERNFSGIQFENNNPKASQEFFKKLFKQIYPDCIEINSNILDRIRDNINDLDSRYLLIISKSSISTYLLSLLLNQEKKEINLYIGSKFSEDLNSEEYALKIINAIQLYMGRNNILILKNLDCVYPALYDLFNQNFTIISNKNYARLAVGSNTNTFGYVNKEFRCIINIDIDKINEEEPPFLNRFEKQILSLDSIFNNEELINESQKIKSMFDDIIIYNKDFYKGISYDLSKLLINCNIDEIQAMMHQLYSQGKIKNEIIDIILSKLALTLPQDIIINIRISGYMQKYSEYSKKIIEYYGKGEHSNFANFLTTINNYKNIVYTFTNILETIKNINNINTPLIGRIDKENIKQINISSLKSESEFERHLEEFYNGNNLKICIIKFMPHESDFMEYIKSFIENKENEVYKKKEKVFIFIVYMSRISNDDIKNIDRMTIKEQKELKSKMLDKTLSTLSGYYQIFIDNLNGKSKINLHEIIKIKKPYELLKKCFDLNKVLYENILESIKLINYNIISQYKGINKENYISKLLDFIDNNDKLKSMMNECIAKQIQKNEEDIIIKIFLEKDIIQDNCIDLLSEIEKYLYNIYISKINLLFYKAENDQFFPSLLSNEEDKDIKNEIKTEGTIITYDNKKDIIEKISKIYFQNLILNDEEFKISKVPKGNKIETMLGLNIPGIREIFNKIIKSVKENIIKKYKKNDDTLREYLEEEEIEQKKETYFKELKEFNISLFNLINKEPLLRNITINNKDENKILYNLLINDYFTIFINNNDKKNQNKNQNKYQEKILDNINNNKRFLNLMVNLRNNIIYPNLNINKEDEDILEKLANAINWIESYSDEINSIQQIFFKLNLNIPELNEQIEKIIKDKQIKFEISDRNPEYLSIVNEVFFLSLDSILRVITSKEEIYDLPSQDFFELINTNKEVLQEALQLENNLYIRSKEALSLQEILKIISLLNEIQKNPEEKIKNIKRVIQYFAIETACINENRQKKIIDNLNDFYKFLIDKFGKDNNNYKLLSFLFKNEYLKITFPDFRELLLDKIFENNNFIKISSEIIKIILDITIESSPLLMINNIDSIKEEDSPLFIKINNMTNSFLDEVIMNIFEEKVSVYFESIKNLRSNLKENFSKYFKDNKDSKNENETGIVFDTSLKIFKQTIELLDSISNSNINNKKNIHLCKLYSIVYIKIYLSKLVYFIKEKLNQIGKIDSIMKVIEGIKNKNFKKVIKIYVLKILYSCINNFELFTKFDFKNSGLAFYTEFPALVESGGQMTLTYFFLP